MVRCGGAEALLERGERIELLVERSQQLDSHAGMFRSASKKLRSRRGRPPRRDVHARLLTSCVSPCSWMMYCKNLRMTLLLIFIILVCFIRRVARLVDV